MEENSEIEQVTTRSVGVRYGLILSVLSILLFVVFAIADVTMDSPARYLAWVVFAVMIFLAHKYYKENGTGFMPYGEGIGIAFWMSLVGSAISSVFTYVYVKFIDTTFLEKMKDMQMEEFQKRGMSDAEIEQAMKFAGMFTTPEAMLIMGIVGGVIVIVIIGLLVTIFTQKKSPEPFA